MGTIKQIDIKNWTYYFYNDIIYHESFKSNLLKVDKKIIYKEIGIYNIGYITIKKIYSVNPLHLGITHANGYIEEKDVNKYLNKYFYRGK